MQWVPVKGWCGGGGDASVRDGLATMWRRWVKERVRRCLTGTLVAEVGTPIVFSWL